MHQQIENIIKKWLENEKKAGNYVGDVNGEFDLVYCVLDGSFDLEELADEVLKVVVENKVEIIKKLQEIRREILKNDPYIANQLENIIIELNK